MGPFTDFFQTLETSRPCPDSRGSQRPWATCSDFFGVSGAEGLRGSCNRSTGTPVNDRQVPKPKARGLKACRDCGKPFMKVSRGFPKSPSRSPSEKKNHYSSRFSGKCSAKTSQILGCRKDVSLFCTNFSYENAPKFS